MAVVRGVKEKVHLPLYDSLMVKPRRQLREVASSSVLRFFVNVQGKTKLETNMQSSSLLPHWNTFEARALRVVLSDLPAAFPEAVEECRGQAGKAPGLEIRHALDELVADANGGGSGADPIRRAVEGARGLSDIEAHLGRLRDVLDPARPAPAAEFEEELTAARPDLINILNRTTIRREQPEAVDRLLARLETLEDPPKIRRGTEESLERARQSLDALRPVAEVMEALQQIDSADLERPRPGDEWMRRLRALLARLNQLDCRDPGSGSSSALRRCLLERLQDPLLVPTDDQLAGRLERIFSTLIYNSVTTFTVGEKTMIQMPTWFFPAGGGVWSEDSRSITHGVPTPQATFRFAEPVVIDTQQNFRVEIEIPERDALAEIQRLYGPLFLWVVLDGFMVRDVQ